MNTVLPANAGSGFTTSVDRTPSPLMSWNRFPAMLPRKPTPKLRPVSAVDVLVSAAVSGLSVVITELLGRIIRTLTLPLRPRLLIVYAPALSVVVENSPLVMDIDQLFRMP